jgi:hypothetical protein
MRAARWSQGGSDAAQGRCLIAHPVQAVERDHEVELAIECQVGRVSDLEGQVGVLRWRKCAPCEGDHVVRGVGAQHRPVRQPGRDRRADLAVAAAQVQHALVTPQREAGKTLFSQPLL